MLAGIHRDTRSDVSTPGVPEYMEERLGRLFVSSFMNSFGILRANADAPGATLSAVSLTVDGQSMWSYHWHNELKTFDGYCVQGSSTVGAPVKLATCNGSNSQRWWHTPAMQLKNVGFATCLAYGDKGAVATDKCATSAEQAWVFRTDSD